MRCLCQLLAFGTTQGMNTLFGHDVRDLDQESDGSWTVKVVNRRTGEKLKLRSKFVFVGAGGARCRCYRSRVSKRPRDSAASR